MFEIEFWRNYLEYVRQILITVLIFYCIEKIIPVEKKQSVKALGFNLIFTIVNLGLYLWLIPQFTPILQFAREKLHMGFITWPTEMELAQAIAWTLVYAFVWDLLQYLGHRLQHSIPFLWEIHRFHHTETALNSSSSARKHIFGHIFEELTIVLPLVLIFSNPVLPVAGQFLLFNCWGYFNHMNARIKLGCLSTLISGPQFHRIHHSILPLHHNKNFAAFFPVIDCIFGTFYQPRDNEYPSTGVRGDPDVHDLIYVNVQPLANWMTSINTFFHRSWKSKRLDITDFSNE